MPRRMREALEKAEAPKDRSPYISLYLSPYISIYLEKAEAKAKAVKRTQSSRSGATPKEKPPRMTCEGCGRSYSIHKVEASLAADEASRQEKIARYQASIERNKQMVEEALNHPASKSAVEFQECCRTVEIQRVRRGQGSYGGRRRKHRLGYGFRNE